MTIAEMQQDFARRLMPRLISRARRRFRRRCDSPERVLDFVGDAWAAYVDLVPKRPRPSLRVVMGAVPRARRKSPSVAELSISLPKYWDRALAIPA